MLNYLRPAVCCTVSALLLSCFAACDIGAGDEPLPAYLHIDTVLVDTQGGAQGSASSKFTDIMVFINQQNIGVFPLPATVPVLSQGATQIDIAPVLMRNGNSTNRIASPLHTFYSTTRNLEPLQNVLLVPSVSYHDNCQFSLIDDFESQNMLEDEDDENDLDITAIDSLVLEGERSATVLLSADNPTFHIGTIELYAWDLSQVVHYLELDYKNEAVFSVSLVGYKNNNAQEMDLLSISPKAQRNKIYIDLSEAAAFLDASFYEIRFAATLPDSLSKARFVWDNIKLVGAPR